jgi:hypothetical protein
MENSSTVIISSLYMVESMLLPTSLMSNLDLSSSEYSLTISHTNVEGKWLNERFQQIKLPSRPFVPEAGWDSLLYSPV